MATSDKLGSVSGIVWNDKNHDGKQNDQASGLANITVKLWRYDAEKKGWSLYDETTSDANGKYEVAEVSAGKYRLEFVRPDDKYSFSAKGSLSKHNDSDVNANGYTDEFDVKAGEEKQHIDAGMHCETDGTISDRVWKDTDGDGKQDAGEAGLGGVTVKLINKVGQVVATTISDANGKYTFSDVVKGDYKVQFVAPTGYKFSPPNATTDDKDSDANSQGLTGIYTLKEGQTLENVAAGLVPLPVVKSDIISRVWEDKNGDGLQSAGEKGMANVKINLLDANGKVIASTTSDSKGEYTFKDQVAGEYRIQAEVPTGYVATLQNVGKNDNIDSDINAQGISDKITLGKTDVSNFDAGFYKPASVGDRVWMDSNGNGKQDANEDGMKNVKVQLYTKAGELVKETVTDVDGKYNFKDLAPGDYKVKFISPLGYALTKANVGADTQDSDANQDGFVNVKLVSGEINDKIDAGLVSDMSSIGNRVWNDKNGDGIQNEGEVGIANVKVNLLDKDGKIVASTTSNATGAYKFKDIAHGDYRVQFEAPEGYRISPQNQGKDEAKDSDINKQGVSDVVELRGKDVLTVDAGMYKPVKADIGDRVWLDNNGDGKQSTGEKGMADIKVNLLDAEGKIVASTTTDKNGKYLFKDVDPSEYQVQVVAPEGHVFTAANVGRDDKLDSDFQVDGKTEQFTLRTGKDDLTKDAGLYKPASLGDKVWFDSNTNGLQDEGEKAAGNVKVQLYTKAGVLVKETTTDASGKYNFKDLAPGEYKVKFEAPEGYAFTHQNVGGKASDGMDSDAGADGYVAVKLVSGEINDSIDAGLFETKNYASLGDYIWKDSNKNGVQDHGEHGLSGIGVNLYGPGGSVVKTVTDANGHYKFDKVIPGTYSMEVKENDNWHFTKANATSKKGEAGDSDANADGMVTKIVLGNAENNMDVDVGMYYKAPPPPPPPEQPQGGTLTLGDRVWNDANQNGIQDLGEPGIANNRVDLLTPDGKSYYTYTDVNGNYAFNNLKAGEHTVVVSKPVGADFTWMNAAGNTVDGLDSDVDSWGKVTVNLEQSNVNVDAGLVLTAVQPAGPAKISGKFWADMNKDNVYTAGEDHGAIRDGVRMVDGYTIELLNESGVKVASVVTGSDGKYSFDNLAPGKYQIYIADSKWVTAVAPLGVDRDPSERSQSDQWRFEAWRDDGLAKGTLMSDGGDWYLQKLMQSSIVQNAGNDDSRDSDIPDGWAYHAKSDWVTVAAGQTHEHLDIGLNFQSPISIDLNGDGIKTVSLEDSQGQFDLLNTGKAINSGWLSKEDGFLAVDNNGDGKVNDRSELFGGKVGEGFAKLEHFDSNGDRVVDSKDARFAELKVWRDADGDHQTDAGEMVSLADAGVASLKVDYVAVPEVDASGNVHLERSSVTMADGSSRDMTDVYFSVSAKDAAEAAAMGKELPSVADLMNAGEHNVAHMGPLVEVNGHHQGDELHSLSELGLHHVHTEYLDHVEFDASGHHMHAAADEVPLDLTDAYSNISLLDAAHVGVALPMMQDLLSSDHSLDGALAHFGPAAIPVHLPHDDMEVTHVSDFANLQKLAHLYEQTAMFV